MNAAKQVIDQEFQIIMNLLMQFTFFDKAKNFH